LDDGELSPTIYFGLVGCDFGLLIMYAAIPAMTMMTTTTPAAIKVKLLLLVDVVELDVLVELELVTGGADEDDVEVVDADVVCEERLVALDVGEVLVDVVVEIPCARFNPQNWRAV